MRLCAETEAPKYANDCFVSAVYVKSEQKSKETVQTEQHSHTGRQTEKLLDYDFFLKHGAVVANVGGIRKIAFFLKYEMNKVMPRKAGRSALGSSVVGA